MAKKAPMIRVKSGLPGNQVALHERHPDHPATAEGEHEVFIYGDQEFAAAKTAEVAKHLASGELVEVKAGDTARDDAPAAPAADDSADDDNAEGEAEARPRRSGSRARAGEGA